MKFAICIAALSFLATIAAQSGAAPYSARGSAAAATIGTYGNGDPPVLASLYFTNQLDGIQGALKDISAAGADLETMKGKLEALVDGSASVYAAEAALETAVDSAAYTNAFVEAPVPTPTTR